MQPESFLPVIADLAVSVAGFTAVIATLRVGQPGPWERHELIRTIGAVAVCLVTIICAALPFSIAGFNVNPNLNWAIPLLISGTSNLVILVWFVRQRLSGNFPLIVPWISVPVVTSLGVLSMVSTLSGLGLLLPFSSGLLVLQLSWTICVAAITLVVTFAITVKNNANSRGHKEAP